MTKLDADWQSEIGSTKEEEYEPNSSWENVGSTFVIGFTIIVFAYKYVYELHVLSRWPITHFQMVVSDGKCLWQK